MHPYSPRAISTAIITAATLLLLGALQVSIVCFTFAAVPMLYFALSAPFVAFALSLNITSLILLGLSPVLCLFFISVIAVPSLLFIAHISRGNSAGTALSELALYAGVVLGAIQYALIDSGGVAAILEQAFAMKDLTAIDPALVTQISWLSSDGSFLLISAAIWWGILLFYASAWIACAIKSKRTNADFRSYVRLTPFTPPAWLFFGLILCAIISLLPSTAAAFIGMSGLVIILLPYCFSGAMYTPLRKWRGMQTGWMFPAMIVFMAFAWPAAILCIIGVWKHAIVLLSKKND